MHQTGFGRFVYSHAFNQLGLLHQMYKIIGTPSGFVKFRRQLKIEAANLSLVSTVKFRNLKQVDCARGGCSSVSQRRPFSVVMQSQKQPWDSVISYSTT